MMEYYLAKHIDFIETFILIMFHSNEKKTEDKSNKQKIMEICQAVLELFVL